MTKILLVEDEAPKRNHIRAVIMEIMPDAMVETARSVNSALDWLESSAFDLLLLDMSLPTFDVTEEETGGRPQGFGGLEVLRHMTMAGISCPTIVITGYEGFVRSAGATVDLGQLSKELFDEFPEKLQAVLHYNSTLDEWRKVLAKFIRRAGAKGD